MKSKTVRLIQMHQCSLCKKGFESKAPNALYCSNKCRSVVKDSSKEEYHRAKARLHSSKRSKKAKAESNRTHRINSGLGILSDKICVMCGSSFMPKSHNSKSCSLECNKISKFEPGMNWNNHSPTVV